MNTPQSEHYYCTQSMHYAHLLLAEVGQQCCERLSRQPWFDITPLLAHQDGGEEVHGSLIGNDAQHLFNDHLSCSVEELQLSIHACRCTQEEVHHQRS